MTGLEASSLSSGFNAKVRNKLDHMFDKHWPDLQRNIIES